MKKLLFILLMSSWAIGQTTKPAKWKDDSKPIEPLAYQEVIEIPDQSAERIYKKLIEWSSDNFVDEDAAISYKDLDLKFIKGSSGFNVNFDGLSSKDFAGRVTFDFKFEAKEGKFRYTIDNIYHKQFPGKLTYFFGTLTTDEECPYDVKWYKEEMENRMWKEIKTYSNERIEAIVLTLKEYLLSLGVEDNW